MAASDVNTLMTAASVARLAGDYATALKNLEAAQMVLGGVPDAGFHDGAYMKYRPEDIQNSIDNVRKSQAAAAGIQRTKLQHTRTSAAT
jgi:hypothetical protein